jgi:hypothetical protein
VCTWAQDERAADLQEMSTVRNAMPNGKALYNDEHVHHALAYLLGKKSSYHVHVFCNSLDGRRPANLQTALVTSYVHVCYCWSLLVWIIGFGPMSLHWLQGMPFWASWLCYVIKYITWHFRALKERGLLAVCYLASLLTLVSD